jgi:3-deoxy-D-manno-octulosonic-acid transferase
MYLIYSFLYLLATLFLFIPQYLKRPQALRRKWLKEKFGSFEFAGAPPLAGPIWVHAVSVGEVNAALPLLRRLKEAFTGYAVILSTITDTGQKVALQRVPDGTKVVYLPFDAGFVLKRCLDRIHPMIFITIETEIWPNIFRALGRKGIPVLVLNGRLSERSSRGYARVSFFMKRVFRHVRVFGMQSPLDAERLTRIGADPEKIKVLGNFKFDTAVSEKMPAWTERLEGPVLVAGSTHRGEEEIMISAYRKNVETFPGLTLILAPRHPERFGEVEGLIRAEKIPFIRRSGLGGRDPVPGSFKSGVVLLDVIGELSAVYGIADIAIIGKSFTGYGGQNPLEPAYWGKAILCGNHMENFPFMKDFYEAGAAFEVDADSLAKKIRELLISPEKARTAGEKARELYLKNSGAVERAMAVIREYVR